MKSIEEMQAELIEAGYEEVGTETSTRMLKSPDKHYFALFLRPEIAIKIAYRHLEKERQFAAMKALLEEEIEWVSAPQESTGLFTLNAIAAIHLMNVVEKAKKILGGGG